MNCVSESLVCRESRILLMADAKHFGSENISCASVSTGCWNQSWTVDRDQWVSSLVQSIESLLWFLGDMCPEFLCNFKRQGEGHNKEIRLEMGFSRRTRASFRDRLVSANGALIELWENFNVRFLVMSSIYCLTTWPVRPFRSDVFECVACCAFGSSCYTHLHAALGR